MPYVCECVCVYVKEREREGPLLKLFLKMDCFFKFMCRGWGSRWLWFNKQTMVYSPS